MTLALVQLTALPDEEPGVQIATESAAHLCRLAAGREDDPVRLSAWLVDAILPRSKGDQIWLA